MASVVGRQGIGVSFQAEAHASAISVTPLRDPALFPPAAVELLERALFEIEREHGSEHASTVEARTRLAIVLQHRGRVAEALPLFEEVLAQRERLQGASAPETLLARYRLALAFRDAGSHRRAAILLAGMGDEVERVLDAGHPLAIASRQLSTELWGMPGC